MELLIASVIPEVVAAAKDYGIRGIATNPTVLAEAGRPWREAVAEAAAIMGGGPFHLQVTQDNRHDMVRQAEEFVEVLGDRLIVKVPISREGLAAVPLLKERGWKVNVTALITAAQGIIAAEAGADYIATYVSRATRAGLDGIAILRDLATYLRTSKSHALLGAGSIHTADEAVAAALAGADTLACDLSVFEEMARHELTTAGIATFKRDWESLPEAAPITR